MRVQTRLALLVAAVAAALLLAVWMVDRSAIEEETLLVRSLEQERNGQIDQLLSLSGQPLRLFAQEYSDWDQMVGFVRQPDPAWAQTNIEEALPTLHAEAAWIFGRDFTPVYSVDLANRTQAPPPPLSRDTLAALVAKNRRPHVFVFYGESLLELRGDYIHAPDEPEDAEQVVGWLFVGRRWSKTYLQELAGLARAAVFLSRPDQAAREIEHLGGELNVHRPLLAPDGNPVAVLHVHSRPAALQRLGEHRRMVFVVLAVCGVAMIAVLGFGTKRWVARPIEILCRSLAHRDTAALGRLQRSSSEFGELARLVDTSFAQRAALESEVEERRRAEAALRESEARYKQLFENSRLGVYRTTPTGRLIAANPALVTALGFDSFADLQGRDATTNEFTGADRREFKAVMARTGEVRGYESDWQRQDGSVVRVRETAWTTRNASGAVEFYDGTVEDVTQQRRAEQAMLEVFEMLNSVDDAVLVNEVDSLRFVYANDGAVRHLGYTREELLRMTPSDIDPDAKVDAMQALNESFRRGERRTALLQTRHRRKDGRLTAVEVRVQHFAPPGGPDLCLAVARDITERQAQEQQRLRAQRLESIGTLAGGVAHDLNNIFTPVMMFVHELRTRRAPPDPEMVEIFEANVRRGAAMVRQLLTFGKGIEGERRVLDISVLVKEIAAIVTSTFPKSIQLQLRLADAVSPVSGDSTQLHQVLLNLCVNARDAMPGGGVLTLCTRDLHLDAQRSAHWSGAKPGHYMVIEVTDTGTGIPPEVLDRIFEPFFTTKGPDKGTGLGLATVLGIVRSHGGFVHVSSEPGRGSTFHVLLPATNGRPAAAAVPQSETIEGRQRLALIADDEPFIRRTARMALEKMNFRVLEAADGNAALESCIEKSGELNLVLTDLNMPQIDGMTLVNALRERHSTTRIVVMSGRFDPDVKLGLARVGAVVLEKPFDQRQLVAALRTALD